jgi:hypothetical protein
VVDIHHHLLKSTTSARGIGECCATREMCEKGAIRSSGFEVQKPRTSDLELSPISPVPPVSLGYPASSCGSELPLSLALRYS